MPWWIWHWRTPIQSWRCLHLLFVSPMNCRIPLIPDACFDIRRSSGFGVLPWESPGAYCWYVLCAHSMYTRRQITPLWRSFTVITHTRAHIYIIFFFYYFHCYFIIIVSEHGDVFFRIGLSYPGSSGPWWHLMALPDLAEAKFSWTNLNQL